MDKEIIIQKEKHLVNAIYRLSLDEQRLFHYAIAKTNPFQHPFGAVYTIAIADVIAFYGINASDSYKYMYDALDRLFDRQITYYNAKQETYVTCRMIHKKHDNKSGVLGFVFGDEINEMIHADKDFLSYKLAQTVNITSVNANRIYEILLYSLQRCPTSKLVKIIKIDELKTKLGLESKYKDFFNFKNKVLEVARSQINKHTDIRISYEVIKKGRSPVELKFTAQHKNNMIKKIEKQKELKLEIIKPEEVKIKTPEKIKKDKTSWAKIKLKLQ